MAHDRLRGEGRAPLEYVGALCLDAAHGVKHVVMVEVRRVIFSYQVREAEGVR